MLLSDGLILVIRVITVNLKDLISLGSGGLITLDSQNHLSLEELNALKVMISSQFYLSVLFIQFS